MKTGTDHNESRMEARSVAMGARSVARELWVIYSELVRAGFREDQSLAILLKLIAVGEE